MFLIFFHPNELKKASDLLEKIYLLLIDRIGMYVKFYSFFLSTGINMIALKI